MDATFKKHEKLSCKIHLILPSYGASLCGTQFTFITLGSPNSRKHHKTTVRGVDGQKFLKGMNST